MSCKSGPCRSASIAHELQRMIRRRSTRSSWRLDGFAFVNISFGRALTLSQLLRRYRGKALDLRPFSITTDHTGFAAEAAPQHLTWRNIIDRARFQPPHQRRAQWCRTTHRIKPVTSLLTALVSTARRLRSAVVKPASMPQENPLRPDLVRAHQMVVMACGKTNGTPGGGTRPTAVAHLNTRSRSSSFTVSVGVPAAAMCP
jgi:hypothetical protein